MSIATIMVVEDDPPLRAALVSTLRAQEYVSIESGSAEETILRFDRDRFDLVLLDLSLPGMDGLDLLARLRAFSAVPVIVLTVRDGKADKLAALDAGADDYVTKPFDTDELLAGSAPHCGADRSRRWRERISSTGTSRSTGRGAWSCATERSSSSRRPSGSCSSC